MIPPAPQEREGPVPPARTIEGHHDFGVLEQRLVDLVRDVKGSDPAGPFAPVAIVAPTRLLLGHLQVLLAERFPALLNLRFFQHDALARAAGLAAGAPLLRTISDGVKEEILAEVIRGLGGELAVYIAARPGSLAALRRTLDDLREAGVEEGAARGVRGLTRGGRDLLRLLAAYARRLDGLVPEGLADRAGELGRLAPRVEEFARTFRLVIHYGAYELTGATLDLMRRVEASGTPLVYLVPFHASAPAFAYVREVWPEMAGASPVAPPGAAPTDRLLGAGLTCLYDETASPPPIAAGRVEFLHAQGAASELREVALRILALHRDEGLRLRRIAIIARSLEPYAPLLAPIFGEHGLPFVGSASLGALREPRVQGALRLARVVLGDFERRPLLDLFGGGLVRLQGIDPAGEAHAWDRLSRDWQVARGYQTWTRDLPRWVEDWQPFLPPEAGAEEKEGAAAFKAARLRQARSLASAVELLHGTSLPLREASSWGAWADGMEGLCATLLGGLAEGATGEPVDAGAGVVLGALSDLRDLDTAGVRFDGPAGLAFFERALSEATVPVVSPEGDRSLGARDNGGVRILDAMQARGLAFDAVFLIGLNADLFPRHPREDPFLGDDDRLLLRRRLSAPLPIKGRGRDEEHLLLAHLLGCARGRLIVSWQRADEEGRAKVPSLALREIARLALGDADHRRVERQARRLPTHPAEAGVEAAGRHGILPPDEARLGAALELRSPRLLLEAVPRLPASGTGDREGLAAGLEMMTRIEDPEAHDVAALRFDAWVGAAAPPPPTWSPTRLESLGACPQHYFFRHVLRVEEVEEPPEGYELDVLRLGRLVHALLRDLYAALGARGHLGGAASDPGAAVRAARDLARSLWDTHTAPLAARMRARYPLLWETTSALWLEALESFLAQDVGALARSGARVIGLEDEAPPSPLPLGRPGAPLTLTGRFDRVVRRAEGDVVVSDYKTSGDLERLVGLTDVLKGSRLQMPLYLLLAESRLAHWSAAGSRVRVEVLGVGPSFDPDEARFEIDPGTFDRLREGVLETLSVLVDLAAAGRFPLNEESRVCAYCPYVRACRRAHAPTLERLAAAPGGAPYALLRRKSTRAPTLDAVRARAGAEEEA